MSTEAEEKSTVPPEDVELAEKYKDEANQFFKSK